MSQVNSANAGVAIGYQALAVGGPNSVAVGAQATANGEQATAFGSFAKAKRQATALGNDVLAYGNSSIAIGNDDIVDARYQDKLPVDTIRNIFGALYGSDGFYSQQTFDNKYISNGSDMRIYSPTYATKLGAIAIGSRAIAGGEVSTSVGSLSFALADRSTAMGIRTFVAQDAVGGTAIGEQSRVFAPNSIAMGNYTESAAQGSFSYGYNAKAIGQGALAFGYDSAAGAKINGEQYTKLLGFTRGLHALDLFKADGSIDDEKVKQFYAGVDTLIKGGDVNGTQFGGVAQMFTDETLFEKDKSKEYLNIGGKSIYKTATSTSTFNSSDAAENSFAMGRYAFALRSNAMAFGYSTIADAQSSLAIGSFAHTDYTADNSIAFGVNTYAAGRNNFVAGYSSRSYANDSMALGVGSYIGQRSANSTAIGKVAKVKENTTNGMAIGNYSEASINNSVALGVNSKTDYDPEDLNQPGWVAKGAIAVPTSAATGIISVGGINNERRITNVASGYADTDAANVAQLRTIDEKFDTRIDSLENGGGVQYQSIDKSNAAGEAAKLAEKLSAEKDYKQYVTLEKQWIGFKAREILNGEQINEASLKAMRDKADALNKDGRFDSLSTELKTLKDQLLKETKTVDKTKYDQYVTNLGNAFDKDSVKSPGNYTPEQIAELKKGTNYDNDGAQGADSIAFGWKAKTNASGKNAIALGVEAGGENGVSGEDGIAIGTKSKVSGNASIAMGKDNNVSGNNSIAVGTALSISGNNAGAFGDPSTINYDNSYSVGNNNTIGTATTTKTEKGSFVVGNNVEVSADNVFVLGSGESSDNKLKASQANSVYLGSGSAQVGTTASRALGTAYNEVKIGNLTFKTFAGNNPSSIVTIGNDSTTRLLQGVAAGTISSASTDAINGSQLFTTNTALNNTATSLKEIIGGEAKFDTNDQGKITVSNLGGTEKNTVHEAIKQAYDTAMAATTSITNLTQNLSTLESKAITFSGDEGSSSKKLGDTLTIAGGATGTDVNASTNKNIKVIGGTNGLFIQLLPTITGLTKVESGEVQTTTLRLGQGGPTLTADSNNISVNSAKITHLANGEDDGDAVNFSQLKTKADQSTVTNLDTKVTNLTNTVGALNLSFTTDTGDTVKGKVDLDTQSLALKGTQNQIETSSTADGQQATFKLAKAVTDKLDLISTEDGVAKGTQQIQLTDKKSGHTAAQTLGQGETIDFTVTGDGSIDTIASGSQIEVKVTQGGIGTNHLAANAVTTEKLATSAVTSEKLADNAVTTTKISNGNVTKDKLDSTLQTEINKITSLAANTVKLGDGIKETSAQRLDKQGGIKFDIKGGEDITTTANTDNITLSLNKATTVTQNDDKAATAKAVYSAVSDARTKLQLASGETLLSLSGGEESGITGRNYTLSLNQTALTNAIDDKFALKDATNLNEDNVTAWKEKLGIDDLASSVSGITFKGAASGSTDAVVGLNKTLDVSGTDIEAKTAAASDGTNAKLELSLSQAVKEKLNQIDTTKGVATANQTIELTADNSTKTGTQRLDKDGGISFAIGGEGAIETNASNGKVTVKVKNSGITEAMLANNAVTTDKIKDTSVTGAKIAEGTIAKSKLDQAVSKEISDATALLDNTITLNGNGGSTTAAQRLDSPNIAFNIKGADSGDITTTASGSDVTLTLNKATAITNTGNDANRVVTSSAVYSALAAAKPAVVKGEAAQGDTNLLDIVGTKSDGINGDTFKLSLSKKNLVTALQDDFVSAVNGAGIAVFDGQTTPSKKAVNLGEGIQLLGDGYVNAAFDTNEYAYTEDGKQHKAPILKFGVSEQVKTAIDKLNNGEALSGVTFNYKANGDGSDGKVGSVNGETGFDFRGDGSPTSTNKNILISVEPTKQEKAGVIDFSLAEDLRDVKSIGSGSKDASGTEARLSFNSKNGDTAANITASNVKLTGLADGDISKTSSDAITGKQIFSIVGTNNSEHGTIADRLNDLESGLRGTVVYTDKNGNKLVKVTNATGASETYSEFYKMADVAGKHYYNGQWYEATAWNDAEGKPTAEGTGTATVATVTTDNILLSLVSAKDGATTTPITLANLESVFGKLSGTDEEKTRDAQTKVAALLKGDEYRLDRAATVADLQVLAQAGLSFSGNDTNDPIHKALGQSLSIQGKSDASYNKTDYSSDNLVTHNDNGTLRIAMKTKPTFQGLSLQNGTDPAINLTPGKTNDGSPTLTVSSGTDGNSKDVVLNGIAAGTADNSAVNLAQLNNLRNLIGVGKDGSNGVNGVDGVDGKNGTPAIGQQGVPGKDGQNGQSFVGPAGQDGLNGTTVINKIQALRDGVAGTMVYTDTAGNRLIAENGTFYKTDLVNNYAKANDGLWYAKDKVNADGSVVADVAGQGKSLKELAKLAGNEDLIAKSDEVILSAVNADGQTTHPITIANLKDNLVAEVTPAEQANAENLAKAANGGKDLTDEQKAAVAKALKEQKVNATVASLLANTNAKELSRAVTLRDLQTVAQAGLSFAGNDSNNPIHQALGTTLLIQGKSGATYSEAVYSADNLITRNDKGTLRIEMKKTPTFDGIILDGKGQDGKDGKDGYIGVDAEGNVVVKNGVDGLAGKDGKDGVDGASKVLTEGSVNASAQLTYKAEGQGYTKDGQKVDKPTVSLADGLNFKGDSNIKTAVNANGEVDITLNKDLTVDSIGGGEGKGKLSFEANNTINANNSRITGIADGKNRGDAVNKGQMDDAIGAVNTNINNIKNEVVNKGMNFATSNDDGKTKSTQTAKLGDTVVVKAGANVDVSEVNEDAEGTFSYTISVKGIPMTYVDADGKPLVQVGDDFYHLQENGAVNFASTATPAGVKVVKDTTKLNDKAVANDQLSTVDVANGEIKNGSQQAVTGGQVADLLGVTVDKDGKVKDGKSGENGIGGTGKNTVSEAISETVKIAKSGNTEVKAGKNVIVTKGTSTNGTTAYTVSMDTSNLEVEKLILGKGDNKTTISVVNQSQYQGSEKAIDVGGTRITNVKDGIDPTDAVNVGQMNKLANATSKAINNVNRRVDHLTQESRAGIAGAMATAGLQQSTERGRTTVSVGSAVFKGESAVALGLSKLSDSGKVGIRISGMTTSNGDTGGSVSVGYTW
ncbi:YadA-like family protein [Gallibacterium anatis]|uniref:YadA-like family protein n=1 Tax=Gallibacterium anatis TaxID=750 RepID=UPI0039FD13D2